jgi:hypothetical protein
VRVVGVLPHGAFHDRPRLFRALERVLPIRFTPRAEGDWRGLDAVIVVGQRPELAEQLRSAALPAFIADDHHAGGGPAPRSVRFADTDRIASRLRGQEMASRLAQRALERNGADAVDLATASGESLWQTSRHGPRVDRVALSLVELQPEESLRDHLWAGTYMPLLALIEFLRELTGCRPPDDRIRATFIVDDPNLHWRSYGFVNFESLAAHARANGYHVTFATVPLDCWFAWPGAVSTFRRASDVLSLTSHGAHHSYAELGAQRAKPASARLFENAVIRMDRFTERWDVRIGRVMVPPHHASALPVHEPLIEAGFEALCTLLGWWSDWPADQRLVAGMAPADLSPAGLPVFARYGVDKREEALICAYLGQPVVFFAHHEDVSDGYDAFAAAASWLATVGEVDWMPLQEIARTNMISHFDESSATVFIRLLSRRCQVRTPAGATSAVVEGAGAADQGRSVCVDGTVLPVHTITSGWRAERIPCTGGQLLDVTVGNASADRTKQRPDIAPLNAYARRAAVESRDRLRPMVHQLGLGPAVRTLESTFQSRRSRRLVR